VYDRAAFALREEMFVLDLPNETRLLSSDDDRLLLTTHRVRFEAKSAAFRRVTSILLEEVSVCEIASRSKPWLLALALLLVLMSLLAQPTPYNDARPLGFAFAVICALAYLATRGQVISVRSSGGAINVPTRGMGLEKAKDFIDQVELAKYRNARK
jgi:hypothetical protein